MPNASGTLCTLKPLPGLLGMLNSTDWALSHDPMETSEPLNFDGAG